METFGSVVGSFFLSSSFSSSFFLFLFFILFDHVFLLFYQLRIIYFLLSLFSVCRDDVYVCMLHSFVVIVVHHVDVDGFKLWNRCATSCVCSTIRSHVFVCTLQIIAQNNKDS